MPDTLIIGAGPFGLSLAAHLGHCGDDYLVVGKPMEFWEKNMPDGMFLRSNTDWHLDVNERNTIAEFINQQNLSEEQTSPLSLDIYLQYARWFIEQTNINIKPAYVKDLKQLSDGFVATLTDDSTIEAKRVIVAVGFKYFEYTPASFLEWLPKDYYSHTCHTVDLEIYRNKRVLIVGGRQSAFEWAALLHEKGAKEVQLTYRHATPDFAISDWTWVEELVNNMAEDPTWFRTLSVEDKEKYRARLWAEGRLKIEYWLKDRINKNNVHLHPNTEIVKNVLTPNGAVMVWLSNGDSFETDHIILATGYKVDVEHLPFINSSLLTALRYSNGFPELDAHLQSNIPGLFFTSFMAAQDFGPFFGFTIGVRTAAKLIADGIKLHKHSYAVK